LPNKAELENTTTAITEPKRDRHGFRGTAAAADFSQSQLPDDALLTERQIGALLQISTTRSRPGAGARIIRCGGRSCRRALCAITPAR
jgi:hypothetical protein